MRIPPRRSAFLLLVLVVIGCGADEAPPDHQAEAVAAADPAPPAASGQPRASATAERAPNRLIREQSPYLQQHAYNPVDWYPWGDEAFAKARAEERPVFLSIGYSTCHWCHVMEHESFENEEIAAYLNEHFVAIKVDREERPDVDNVYMSAVQAMTGRGGWPLSAFLSPEAVPFFGGTYFPPHDRGGQRGFLTLLQGITNAWQTNRAEVLDNADRVLSHLQSQGVPSPEVEIPADIFDQAQAGLLQSFDPEHGGFGKAPKFPRSHTLSFLLRHWARTERDESLDMVRQTLDQMARGGLRDHLGGGFHRYSVDARWLVPHFEKMLYDQAILARTYLEAYQATGVEADQRVARGVFDYVARDLTGPNGGFYAAEDADSEGEEGKFYVWRPEEIVEVLGAEEGALFNRVYGVTDAGNFVHRRSVLHLTQSLADWAQAEGEDAGRFAERLANARRRLLEVRSERIRPHLDDKIVTAWNGLMISALAYGAQVLEEPRYAERAARAAEFILQELRDADGYLLRRYRGGEAAIPAFIDDYAFLVNGLVDLYQATFEARYLAEAVKLARQMLELFGSEESGGFSFRGTQHEPLVVETREIYDGALPSGNSVAAWALLRLGHLTGDPDLTERGRQVIQAFSTQLTQSPISYTQLLIAQDFAVGPTLEVVVAGDPHAPDTQAMVRALRQRFLPSTVVALRAPGAGGEALATLAPFVQNQTPLNGRAAAYVCKDHTCQLPTDQVNKMLALIDNAGQP